MAPGTLDAYRTSVWSLTEFVDAANALLPDFLPKDTSGRLADDVNPRLVRHYATLGLLPEPAKEGREARYLFEHLTHLLVVRKLLAEGFGSAAIRDALAGRGPDELVALLEGHVRVALVPEGAMSGVEAYASAQRAASPPRELSSPPEPSTPPEPSAAATRSRAELLRAVRAKAGLGPMDQGERRVSSAARRAPEPGEARSSHERHGAAPEAQPSRAPSSQVRSSQAPSSQAPSSQARSSDAPSSDAPASPAPSIQAPSTQPRSSQAPSSQASDADERFHAALAAIFRPSDWTRIRIDEGLELHVRDDYRLPRNRVGDEDLLRLLKAALLDLEQRTKGRS